MARLERENYLPIFVRLHRQNSQATARRRPFYAIENDAADTIVDHFGCEEFRPLWILRTRRIVLLDQIDDRIVILLIQTL